MGGAARAGGGGSSELFPSVMSESGPWSQVDPALSPEASLGLTSLLCKWRRWH